MRWFVEQRGDVFVARAPYYKDGVFADAIATIGPGETWKGVPYDKLEDGQIFEEDNSGDLKELGVQSVVDDIDRILAGRCGEDTRKLMGRYRVISHFDDKLVYDHELNILYKWDADEKAYRKTRATSLLSWLKFCPDAEDEGTTDIFPGPLSPYPL